MFVIPLAKAQRTQREEGAGSNEQLVVRSGRGEAYYLNTAHCYDL